MLIRWSNKVHIKEKQVMIKYLMAIMVGSMFIINAPAQDSAPASETEAAEEAVVVDQEQVDVDDADLDDQTYEEDEDDFIPTEEIPADTPIPFPTNI